MRVKEKLVSNVLEWIFRVGVTLLMIAVFMIFILAPVSIYLSAKKEREFEAKCNTINGIAIHSEGRHLCLDSKSVLISE